MSEASVNSDPTIDRDPRFKSSPQLRTDLRFYPQSAEGKPIVVIEDPVTSRYFRIGKAEYLLLSQLNGKTSVEDAFHRAKQQAHKSNLNFDLHLEDAVSACEFLFKSNLLADVDEAAIQAQVNHHTQAKLTARLNPIFQKFPVGNPSRLLDTFGSLSRSVFSFLGFVVWLTIVLVAVYHLIQPDTAFWSQSKGILAGSSWINLVLIWIALKAIHEWGHAACCHRFGGRVNEFGLAFICFFPVAYVNVTSCWRFPNKWHKMAVSASGIYVELFVAALAAISWFYVDSPILKDILFDIFIVASFTTILFNINPLMKFDGYYFLADYAERPRLYAESMPAVGRCLSWMAWGNSDGKQYPTWVTAYGIAVLFWRLIVCIGIFLTLSLLGNGIGLVFALIALGFWFAPVLNRLNKANWKTFFWRPARQWVHFTFASLLLVAVLAGSGKVFLLPRQVSAFGVVNAKDPQVVRASSNGFVEQVFVEPNQFVTSGTPLIELRNQQLRDDLAKFQLDEKKLQLEIEQFRADGKTSLVAAESERLRQVKSKIDFFQHRVEDLTIRAKIDGKVIASDLAILIGTYLKEGDEILTIAVDGQKEILAAVPQFQLDGMGTTNRNELLDTGTFYLPETGAAKVTLAQVAPKATLVPVSKLLCANVGGPLPIRQQSLSGQNEKSAELLEPHVSFQFDLATELANKVAIGRRVRVILTTESTSFGYQLFKNSKRWLAKKIDLATRQAQ